MRSKDRKIRLDDEEPSIEPAESSALCKFRGMLTLWSTAPASSPEGGACPECGHRRFIDGGDGWTRCANDCGFEILTDHAPRRPAAPPPDPDGIRG
jgi:hypothetical protein